MIEDLAPLLVALLVAVVGPFLLTWLTGRQRRAEKMQDYKRQDEVAERAALVAEKAEQAAQLLVEDNKRVASLAAAAALKTTGQLEKIHTLVNSNMTAAMQAELDATTREAAMMRIVIGLRAEKGDPPSPDATAALARTDQRIGELRAALEDRHEAQAKVDAADFADRKT
jgi:hypothetical protein